MSACRPAAMNATGSRLPSASSREVVEDYVARVAPRMCPDFGFVTLVPWGAGRCPENVMAAPGVPLEGPADCHWKAEDVAALVGRFSTLLLPCTFETLYEKRAMRRLLESLQAHEDVSLFVLQLLEVKGDPSPEDVQRVMARHDALISLGADAVILDPEACPERLCQQICEERQWFEANSQRAKAMFAHTDQDLQGILESHHELLWESVPRAVMPKFAPIDRTLVEASGRVGKYRLSHEFKTVEGKVMLAVDQGATSEKVAIKVYDKSDYTTFGDLECMYRELVFLTEVLRHPHIVACHGMLHSLSNVYFIMDFCGMANLHQVLLDQPGYRLDVHEAMDCAMQIAGALGFCHSRSVVHRQVSLEHIVMSDQPGKAHFRLVDFFSAVHCPEPTRSKTVCGVLPCIAPEVAAGEQYLPKPADCWSLGAVLLETAGGQGSLMKAVGWHDGAGLQPAAASIRDFFAEEGSHSRALAGMGGVSSGPVLAELERLLRVRPGERATMQSIVRTE